jgi:2-(1,2-epoxy-1,2-dihydrophenyl)acetyl-CoA isomerase
VSIGVEREGAVLRLCMESPRRNALDDESVAALIIALEDAGQDDGVRAVLLAGAGADFCSGFDIVGRNQPEVGGGGARPRAGSIQRRLPAQAHRLIPLVLEVEVPVVCAVRGWAAGLGFQLALAADFTVAAHDARFWQPFVARGFTPDSGAAWLLPRMVGLARARELLILGRELSGAEAEEWGLIHRAVEPDTVDDEADALAARLASAATVAVGLSKRLLNAGMALDLRSHLADEAFALEVSSRSSDFREGLRAFTEKRAPEFEGR